MLKSNKYNIKWKSTSDTETLLECVSAIGVNKTISYLRGMFAFSLFDRKNKKIYLIRDRYGEKPLYLLDLKNGKFAFSSDIASFSFVPGFSPNLDLKAASCFFQRGYIAAPMSIWKNVKKIMPGSITIISFSKNKEYYISGMKRYWSAEEIMIRGQTNLFEGSYENHKFEIERYYSMS